MIEAKEIEDYGEDSVSIYRLLQGDPSSVKQIAEKTKIGEARVCELVVILVRNQFLRMHSQEGEDGPLIWTTIMQEEQEEEVKKEEEPIEPVHLDLIHCGQFSINDKEITGWFQPISLFLWREIVGFHKQFSLDFDAETVSYHRWNPSRKAYDTIIPYQTTTGGGLSVSTDWQDGRNVQLLNDYAKKWGCEFFPACTIHTHVAASAFESGVDAADEKDQPGWHLTLGHLAEGKDKIDIDSRFRLPKFKKVKALTDAETGYKVPLINLFEEGTDMDVVYGCPHNNKNFNQFRKRVTVTQTKSSWSPKGKSKWRGPKILSRRKSRSRNKRS